MCFLDKILHLITLWEKVPGQTCKSLSGVFAQRQRRERSSFPSDPYLAVVVREAVHQWRRYEPAAVTYGWRFAKVGFLFRRNLDSYAITSSEPSGEEVATQWGSFLMRGGFTFLESVA